jgi:hypothetical protein
MSSLEEKQLRGWAIDYALRLHNKEEVVTSRQILEEAKQFHAFMEGRPAAQLHEIKSGKK